LLNAGLFILEENMDLSINLAYEQKKGVLKSIFDTVLENKTAVDKLYHILEYDICLNDDGDVSYTLKDLITIAGILSFSNMNSDPLGYDIHLEDGDQPFWKCSDNIGQMYFKGMYIGEESGNERVECFPAPIKLDLDDTIVGVWNE
jgi:hypothetical protein